MTQLQGLQTGASEQIQHKAQTPRNCPDLQQTGPGLHMCTIPATRLMETRVKEGSNKSLNPTEPSSDSRKLQPWLDRGHF